MISIKFVAKQVEKFTADNAPAILTGVGVAGSVSSVVLATKASFPAALKIGEETNRREANGEREMTKPDFVKLVWKDYIPAAGVLGITVTSIIFANRINTKRIAAMAAAYSLSEKAYSEYKDKVVEKFSANKERQIRDEIAQDHVTGNPPKDSTVIITGNGDVLCHDLPTGRYFRSSMEKLRSVMNDVNQQVNSMGFAPLSDLYVSLGLTSTPYSEQLGWTTDKLLDLQFSAVLTDESQPCISIDYQFTPIREYLRGCELDPEF